MMSVSGTLNAGMWQRLSGSRPPTNNAQAVFPDYYSLYYLNQDDMQDKLSAAGTDPAKGLLLTLPSPDNQTRTFTVWETPMLAPELQALYPGIHTYTAVATDNPLVTAKLDYTMYGFRAIVFDGDKTYMIDPYSRSADGYYLAYYKKDMTQSLFEERPCGVTTEAQQVLTQGIQSKLAGKPGGTAARTHGSIRRTYKCAISCTGEYAELVTGGVPSTAAVLSIITSTINRCNGVFERELSVTLELIANNNTVIYLNPDTDPFECNLNNDCLINENQDNMDDVLAGFSYDIGHIFNTAGGGLAQLASTCTDGKASGVSGSFGPEDIGTIIHEMGHQFGAPHTFNANTGGCEGNGSEASAYEPGSGSTIMSYAGLCAPNDVAGASDEYYHVSSLMFITNHIDLGDGATCGTTETGPAIVSLANNTDTFFIPQYTPFELFAQEATGTGAITYCWEQYNLGQFGEAEGAAPTWEVGPTFRSFPPTASRLRTFPEIQYAVDETYGAVGQRLSMIERELDFKLTARSLDLGWGTFNYTDRNVKIIVAPQNEFRVTGPTTTELYEVGATKTITWDKAGTDTMPINCHFVDIQMSIDNGRTFPFHIATNTPNTGSYNFTVPDIYSDSVIFKVKGADNIFFDVSHVRMQIHGTPNSLDDITNESAFQVFPNPATSQVSLRSVKPVTAPLQVTLHNVIGRQVWNGTMTQSADINVAQLARGTYFVHILDSGNGKKTVRKVILQ